MHMLPSSFSLMDAALLRRFRRHRTRPPWRLMHVQPYCMRMIARCIMENWSLPCKVLPVELLKVPVSPTRIVSSSPCTWRCTWYESGATSQIQKVVPPRMTIGEWGLFLASGLNSQTCPENNRKSARSSCAELSRMTHVVEMRLPHRRPEPTSLSFLQKDAVLKAARGFLARESWTRGS
jgi:hypothetical protein